MRPTLGFVLVAIAVELSLLLIGNAALIGKRWAKAERCGRWAFIVALGAPFVVLLLLFAATAAPAAFGWAMPFDRADPSVPVSQKARVLAETISTLMNCSALALALSAPSLVVWLVGRSKRRAAAGGA